MASREGLWNSLPSVILVEILSYLSHSERLCAASTCKNWRGSLYHPSFWQDVRFEVRRRGRSLSRARFQASCFASKVRRATVVLDAADPVCVQLACDLLNRLGDNGQLRALKFKPSHGRLECPGRNDNERERFLQSMVEAFENIVRNCSKLKEIGFGCNEEILVKGEFLLALLEHNQSNSLEQLHMATVKDDPDSYLLMDIPARMFQAFHCLKVLSLDNDYVTNDLLEVFSQHSHSRLGRLNILVHGIDEGYPGTSDSCWALFAQCNPECEVRLSLVHSYDAIEVLHSHVLRPSMPLSHFRALFCGQVNLHALQNLSSWYATTLCSFMMVDSLFHPNRCGLMANADEFHDTPDPLVILAWRCKKLKEMVIIGYEYFDQDVIAIARLRGSQLTKLEISERDIVYGRIRQYSDYMYVCQEVGVALQRPWKPLPMENLAEVIKNPSKGDSDSYLLPTILADQDY